MPDFVIALDSPSWSAPNTFQIRGTDYDTLKSSALVSAYFRREDLSDLLRQDGCEGLRFYVALNKNDDLSVLAVGSTGLHGDDMLSNHTSSCFVSEEEGPASLFNEQGAIDLISRAHGLIKEAIKSHMDEETPFQIGEGSAKTRSIAKVFFYKDTLESLLPDNALGIRFFSNRIRFEGDPTPYSTLTAVTVSGAAEESNHGVVSALPCPPHCGGAGGAYDANKHGITLD